MNEALDASAFRTLWQDSREQTELSSRLKAHLGRVRQLLQAHPVPAAPGAYLLPLDEGPARQWQRLTSPMTIGRSRRAGWKLDHPSLSKLHAEVSCLDGLWTIADLGSRNGTFVNGVRGDCLALHPGDILQLGAIALLFTLVEDFGELGPGPKEGD